MKLLDWIIGFFGGKKSIDLKVKAIEELKSKIAIQEFALNVAANLIAGTISKCEFKTFYGRKEMKSDEYYLWNIEPNKNQNSSEFIQELIYKLIYQNEVLVFEVGGELYIADSFNKNEYATLKYSFSDVTKKDFTFNKLFFMDEVIYLRLNNRDIKAILMELTQNYSELINVAIDKYKKSGGRKGIVKIDSTLEGDEEFEKTLDDIMNNRFRNYFNSVNAVLNLPEGISYTENKYESGRTTSEVNDINSLIEKAFDRVAQALRIPPALMRGEIADISKVTDNYLTFCIDPLTDMLAEEINRKRYGKLEYLKGSYLKIDTTTIKHIDVFSNATNVDKLIACGAYNADELRIKLGDEPLNTEFSKKYFITKNYQEVTELKGGEVIEQNNISN